MAFAPDGQTVATASEDAKVKLWDPTTGQMRRTLPHKQSVRCLAFAPDGKLTLNGHKAGVLSVAFAPDGQTFASASADGTVKVGEVATGEERLTFTGTGGGRPIFCFAFAPDGKTLAVGAGDPSLSGAEVRLWDVLGKKQLVSWKGHLGLPLSLAFAPDGKTLATGSYDHTVKLWDPTTGQERSTIRGHESYVFAVAFAPDGQILATGSSDCLAKLWNPAARQECAVLQAQAKVRNAASYSLAFAPDGKTLASSGSGAVKVWAVERRRRTGSLLFTTTAYDSSFRLLIIDTQRYLSTKQAQVAVAAGGIAGVKVCLVNGSASDEDTRSGHVASIVKPQLHFHDRNSLRERRMVVGVIALVAVYGVGDLFAENGILTSGAHEQTATRVAIQGQPAIANPADAGPGDGGSAAVEVVACVQEADFRESATGLIGEKSVIVLGHLQIAAAAGQEHREGPVLRRTGCLEVERLDAEIALEGEGVLSESALQKDAR